MRIALLILIFGIVGAHAGKYCIVKGGISPDKRWAVVVVPQKEGQLLEDVDGSVYLFDLRRKKRVQELDGCDSWGGYYGTTKTNVDCKWSPGGEFVAVNYRAG